MQLKITKEMGNRSTEGYAYNGLGVCYSKLGHYAKANEYHKRRLEIAKENGEKESEGIIHYNIDYKQNTKCFRASMRPTKKFLIVRTGRELFHYRLYGHLGC